MTVFCPKPYHRREPRAGGIPMNPTRVLASMIVAVLFVASVTAQTPTFPEADVKKLAQLVGDMYAKPAKPDPKVEKKREQAKADFAKEVDRISKGLGGTHILKCDASWAAVFSEARELAKAPSGLGRATEFSV